MGCQRTGCTAPVLINRKCHRDEPQGVGALEETDNYQRPQKRVRAGKETGTLKAMRSADRTRNKPLTRIPRTNMNNEPKEAGRGEARLATPTAQGIHHRHNWFGLRGVWRRNRCSSSSNKKRSTSSRESSTRRCSRPRKPTGLVIRFVRSSAGSVATRH